MGACCRESLYRINHHYTSAFLFWGVCGIGGETWGADSEPIHSSRCSAQCRLHLPFSETATGVLTLVWLCCCCRFFSVRSPHSFVVLLDPTISICHLTHNICLVHPQKLTLLRTVSRTQPGCMHWENGTDRTALDFWGVLLAELLHFFKSSSLTLVWV